MNCLSKAKRAQVVSALIEGNSIRATVRMTGVCKDTVLKLLCDLGSACAGYHNQIVRGIRSRRVQCDEIWNFCYAKHKNIPEKLRGEDGVGDVWTWTAIDADTKLAISYLVGDRGAGCAYRLMRDVAERVSNRIQLTTDGHRVYANAVEDAFGAEIDYAMLVKIYGAVEEKPETRYSPAQCIGTRLAVLSGKPDPAHISTSFVERQNLTMRMSMRRFTRLTNAFSKKLDNLKAAVALHFMHYNFCRVHQTLRVTPAMQAGIADHVWTLEELVGLLESKTVSAVA
jgi:IS1 family transposase